MEPVKSITHVGCSKVQCAHIGGWRVTNPYRLIKPLYPLQCWALYRGTSREMEIGNLRTHHQWKVTEATQQGNEAQEIHIVVMGRRCFSRPQTHAHHLDARCREEKDQHTTNMCRGASNMHSKCIQRVMLIQGMLPVAVCRILRSCLSKTFCPWPHARSKLP